MEQHIHMPTPEGPAFLKTWGFWAVLAGALAVLLVFAQFIGPSFEAKPSVGSQIGEIAGDIKRSAWRSFFGLSQPAPEPAAPSIWIYAAMAAPVFALVAIVLSLISGLLRENWRFPVYGTSLGVAAIVFQFVWWIALLICGIVLLVAIIENIGDFFSF
jgi:ABC-type multidrug transport system fused ATPase/permease subunit